MNIQRGPLGQRNEAIRIKLLFKVSLSEYHPTRYNMVLQCLVDLIVYCMNVSSVSSNSTTSYARWEQVAGETE